MKLLGFLIVLLSAMAAAMAKYATINHNGQPGCKTSEELSVRYYRNNWDPTAYWECSALNSPASLSRCPAAMLFLDEEKACIEAMDWYWTQPQEPPSRP